MPQGKTISADVQWIVVRLGATMSVVDVSMYADISQRSVRRIIAHFNKTGNIIIPNQAKPTVPRTLCDYDVEVRFYYRLITRYPLVNLVLVSFPGLE
jgi:hypothetical protein